jgi:hypothetical protein
MEKPMDKILSARVDEGIVQKINLIAHKLKTTKKSVIEHAINNYAKIIEKEEEIDVLDLTFGAWKRDETPDNTIIEIKAKFAQSMRKNQQ